MPATANPLTLLSHAALSHLPRTGIILASNDLAGGYVNDTARELLMGVRRQPETPPESTSDDETSESEAEDKQERRRDDYMWMEDGLWISQPSEGGRWTWDGAEFFRGITNDSRFKQGDKGPEKGKLSGSSGSDTASKTASSVAASKDSEYSGVSQGEVQIGAPTQLYKMTVATILQRSLSLTKARKISLRKAAAKLAKQTTLDNANAALRSVLEESESQSDSALPAASKPKPKKSPAKPKRPSSKQPAPPPKKPYKVFDATFSQRIIDPLEPLLELVARKGERPETSLAGFANGGSMVIGIEVEVPESSAHALGSFPQAFELPKEGSSTSFGGPMHRKNVRRRLVEVSGAPVLKPGGTHLGGMIILRDVTDEKARTFETSDPNMRLRDFAGKRISEGAEGYFKQILDSMPQVCRLLLSSTQSDAVFQMVWTTTPMGSHDYFNNQWYV